MKDAAADQLTWHQETILLMVSDGYSTQTIAAVLAMDLDELNAEICLLQTNGWLVA
jgi:hypothetical protein